MSAYTLRALDRARRQERARVELQLLRSLHRTTKAYVGRKEAWATFRALEAAVHAYEAWETASARRRRRSA